MTDTLTTGSAVASNPTASVAEARTPQHIDFVDGLRGLAALYVAVYHIMDCGPVPASTPQTESLLLLLHHGHYAVGLFIVISGFCLMLPISQSETGHFRYSLQTYFLRRARRIIPPFYGALIYSIIIYYFLNRLALHYDFWWFDRLKNVRRGHILSHVLLINNLTPPWRDSVDPPTWSVATEWQIYFVFPLILLPVWRRFGNAAMIAAAFLIGLAPHLLFNKLFETANFWFIGLFALGMLTAVVAYKREPRYQKWMTRAPFGIIALLILIGMLALCLNYHQEQLQDLYWVSDTVVGVGAMCLILHCVQLHQRGMAARSLLLRALESRACLILGAMSYSLYLVHFPIMDSFHALASIARLSDVTRIWFMLGAGIPVMVAVGYIFHVLVEKRFMNMQQRAQTFPALDNK